MSTGDPRAEWSCSKCSAKLSPCHTCGKPAQCGDWRCAACVEDWLTGDDGPEPVGSTPVPEEPGGHLVSSGEFATAEHDLPREKSRGRAPVSEEPAPPPTPKPFPCYWVAGTEECNGYSRGELDAKIAEAYERGRRQATEGWERDLRYRHADGTTIPLYEQTVEGYMKMARRVERQYDAPPGELQQRLVGPWEPAEKPEGGAR